MVFLYPIAMDLKDLPFKIGMQYENWEFDLEPIELAEYYDKYSYIKTDISKILDFDLEKIYLYFKLDILFKIEIKFKNTSVLTYHHISEALDKYFNESGGIAVVNADLFEIVWKKEKLNFQLQNHLKSKMIKLVVK